MSAGGRAWALTTHGIRQSLRGRRLVGLAVVALVPVALAFSIRSLGGTSEAQDLAPALLVVGLGLVVPLIALLVAVGAFRDEIRSGTIVHLVTRPVRRETVFTTRLLASAIATTLIAAAALTLPLAAGGTELLDTWSTALGVSALASLAYVCLFALLGALTRRAVLVGLVYLVAWEGVVASTGLIFRDLTIAYWVRSIVVNQGGIGSQAVQDTISGTPAATGTSVLVLGAVTLVAGLAGALWFGHREFPGPEPED